MADSRRGWGNGAARRAAPGLVQRQWSLLPLPSGEALTGGEGPHRHGKKPLTPAKTLAQRERGKINARKGTAMKLCTNDAGNGPRAGVVVGEQVLDVATLLGEQGGLRDVRALLELPNDPLTRLKSALGSARAAQGVSLASVRLRAPILQPPTVRDFMVYEGHATAGGTRQVSDSWYRLPIFYFSSPLRIFGPEDAVPYPSASDQLDYELELGAVIGREGSNITEADAFAYIAGFTIFNDWSCRDLQRDEMEARLGPAKGKDSATSLGPWIVTTDELAPFIRNGFPARYLQPGDIVEIAVERIGILRNTIAAKLKPDPNYRFKAPWPK